MGRVAQGGTKKWCPTCQSINVCAAVNPSSLGEESEQRWYQKDHTDIQWFRRALVCLECGSSWLTAELPESFLDELVELRDALREIKENAEIYVNESDKASETLKKLSASLSVLRALNAYKKE
ncbi:hypothetical protein ACNQFN_00405 [Thauera butanivorans]|uniref:hypothetical protein n=1 Tax=Thauera butanivorans TaxID=86174 RepID=UPI003AB335FB